MFAIALASSCNLEGASFIPLGFLRSADNNSGALGVSDDAVFVGGRSSGPGPNFEKQAVRWTVGGNILGLGFLPGATDSSAFDMSVDGQVLVGISGGRAFRWSPAVGMGDLGALPGKTYHVAWAVSGDGSIVVGSGDVGGREEQVEPFKWTASGGMVGLGVLAGASRGEALAISRDGKVIVGYSGNNTVQAFRRGPDGVMRGLGFLPGYVDSIARGVSSNGSFIVGECRAGWPNSQAFRWTEADGMTGLGILPGFTGSDAHAVSGDGSIVVGWSGKAFIWDVVHGIRDLQAVLTTEFGLNLSGWNLTVVEDISSDGNAMVGEGINPQGNRQAWMVKFVTTPPAFTIQPQSQTVAAASTVTLSVTVTGTGLLFYQWRKNGVALSGQDGSTLTLNSVGASDSGRYSVVVWNAYGSEVSATAYLSVLADGANGSQPAQIPNPSAPAKPTGVDSLVVVTHGWEALGPILDVSWVNTMADAIRQKITGQGLSNWLVHAYIWDASAWGTPNAALTEAVTRGGMFGRGVGPQHWQHVHLIGHSAGAGFVEAAAKAIKETSTGTVVHSTFLDPYLAVQPGTGPDAYGTSADWADNYFAQDLTGTFTQGKVNRAYNADVTWTDLKRDVIPVYCVPPGSPTPWLQQLCGYQASSSHSYPHDFYFASIIGTNLNCAAGYGFTLSKEGGGWNNRPNYPVGNDPLVLCGTSALVQNPSPLRLDASLQIGLLPYANSSSGASLGGSSGFTLTSSSPQSLSQAGAKSGRIKPQGPGSTNAAPWLAMGLTITNAVNFVAFDAGFTSTNAAEGLLTVYWNTNRIGMVDERVASPSSQTYRFALPSIVTNGLYTLSFRLDVFNNTASSITVTNVATGFVGITQPITLGAALSTNGTPLLQLTGAPGFNYLLQSSTNLADWAPAALLVNTNGTVLFATPAVTNASQRFYRAVLSP